jgi:hypothetical protein
MIKPTLNELTSHPEETNDRLLLFFELSSAEKRIVDDVENMRKTREASGYTDLQDQPSSSNTFDHYMTSSIDRTKILTTVNPQVSIRNFNKHTPSPVLGRQANSESPTLPFSNITERSFTKPNGFSPSNKMYSSMRIPREVNGTPTQNTSILNALGKNVTDFARSGSARGQDLMNFFKQSSLPRPPKTAQEEFRNTPTRKLSTKFEKHFMKQEEIPTELNEIEKRTIEIDQLIEYTEGIIRSSETSDENKMKLINKKQILVQEKDRLTGRQDLLNKYLDYNETKEKVDDLRTKIDELTQSKTSGNKQYNSIS